MTPRPNVEIAAQKMPELAALIAIMDQPLRRKLSGVQNSGALTDTPDGLHGTSYDGTRGGESEGIPGRFDSEGNLIPVRGEPADVRADRRSYNHHVGQAFIHLIQAAHIAGRYVKLPREAADPKDCPQGKCQSCWRHRVKATDGENGPRIRQDVQAGVYTLWCQQCGEWRKTHGGKNPPGYICRWRWNNPYPARLSQQLIDQLARTDRDQRKQLKEGA